MSLCGDIHEQILLRLGVKDLTRFKSVCTEWYLLISGSRFIKKHLNHTKKYSDEIVRYAKIHINPFRFCNVKNDIIEDYNNSHIVGSCNGLVCLILSNADILVANPLTREVKKLQKPIYPFNMINSELYWGFGYDSSIDDYKVVLGFRSGMDHTFFQLLTLKSNVLKVIGKVKYQMSISNRGADRDGIFCNGSLYWWFMDNVQNCKQVILSFDLSKEEFKQIPQPDNPTYQYTCDSILGVTKEDYLCIFRHEIKNNKWVMKNDPSSWEFKSVSDHFECVRKDYIPTNSSLNHVRIWLSTYDDDNSRIRFSTTSSTVPPVIYVASHVTPSLTSLRFKNMNRVPVFIKSHIFLASLVSPHFNNGRPKRKRCTMESSNKFIWRDDVSDDPGLSLKLRRN